MTDITHGNIRLVCDCIPVGITFLWRGHCRVHKWAPAWTKSMLKIAKSTDESGRLDIFWTWTVCLRVCAAIYCVCLYPLCCSGAVLRRGSWHTWLCWVGFELHLLCAQDGGVDPHPYSHLFFFLLLALLLLFLFPLRGQLLWAPPTQGQRVAGHWEMDWGRFRNNPRHSDQP